MRMVLIYPTITHNNQITHAVKDEMTCLCGFVYRKSLPKKQKERFESIYFNDIRSINCRYCQSVLKIKGKIHSSFFTVYK